MKSTFSLFLFLLLFIVETTAQDFPVTDVLVSASDAEIGDIEMDPYNNRICWQSLDDHKLWICHLDTSTWALADPYGMEILIDSSLTPLEQTSNSGEWGFDMNFNYIVYNKLMYTNNISCSGKIRYIAVATETNLGWVKTILYDAPHRINPHATRNPTDSVVAIHYIRLPFSVNTKYKFLDNPYDEHAVSWFKDAHWAADEQVMTGIIHDDQVALFNPLNPGIPLQLTNDPQLEYSVPFMWRAPEHDNARMFFARTNNTGIRVFKETSPNSNNYKIFTQFSSPSSNPLYNKIASPEPFVYQGHSYITFMASSSPHEIDYVPAEIWIVKLDSLDPVFRMVSDTSVSIRTDPEPFATSGKLLVYYTEILNPNAPDMISRIRKCETGFGPGYITAIKENVDITSNMYQVYPNPFHIHISLKNSKGKELYLLSGPSGQTIWKGRQIENKDFSDLNPGLYFLKVISEPSIHTIKMIKE